MREDAYLAFNPIMVYSYVFLFNCTTVGPNLDCMKLLTSTLRKHAYSNILKNFTTKKLKIFR